MLELAVIIPAKNEAASLPTLVDRLHLSLLRAKIKHCILVIDDYSTDATYRTAKKLEKDYPLKVYKKEGRPGKGYAILEGARRVTTPYIAFIDGNLNYPPEALSQMAKLRESAGLIIAKRKAPRVRILTRILASIGRFLTGKVLFDLPYDITSGLKLFKREIIEQINEADVSPWTLDIPLIVAAHRLGYVIEELDIEYSPRRPASTSKRLSQLHELFHRAIRYRLTPEQPITIPPEDKNMLGAGLVYKSHRYITHTQLPHHTSAIHTISWWQKALALGFIGLCVYAAFLHSLTLAIVIMAILSTIYFTDVLFNLALVLRSLQFPPEITTTDAELAALDDKKLPTYTILCPLYKEAHMVPHFVESIAKLEWPKNKLDVVLLLEEDDVHTIAAARAMDLPKFVRILVVPDSLPKTKPKACNFGLCHAKGEYLVIFDAEDAPDPLQLKKVYAAFQKAPRNVKCIQAKLNYYNPSQNLLTRFFTAEYSLWFDVILTGLQSFQTTIPLGGTSNHFRTQDLLDFQGWDPFNVTEDCDLGVRLFKHGGRTAIVDSVTLEEANSNLRNWIRQRSRWIKGYMQTYLLHMRDPIGLVRSYGWHALIFQLTIGGKISFLLINPLMWVLTVSYFALHAIVGEAIEALFPSAIFYMAVTSLVFGNFLFIYYYMIGLAKREQWSLIKYVLLVPFYWLAASYAAAIALYQLIVKPHYWEKTIHGLHLKKEQLNADLKHAAGDVIPEATANTYEAETKVTLVPRFTQRIVHFVKSKEMYLGGAGLIIASMAANVLNFVYNSYLGRKLAVTDFGTISLMGSLLFLTQIPFGALGSTVNYKVGFLNGRYGTQQAWNFWTYLRSTTRLLGFLLSVLWILSIPFLMHFFHVSDELPFILFTAVWFVGLASATDRGYWSGKLIFNTLAALSLLESLIKLGSAVLLVETGRHDWVYASIPLSILVSFIIGRAIILLIERRQVRAQRAQEQATTTPVEHLRFPKRFFLMSILSGLSTMSFLSLDLLMIKHFLSPQAAGEYALISLVGKMVFFISTLASQFVLPIVSNQEGSKKDSKSVFGQLLLFTALLSGIAFTIFGPLGPWTLPLLLGERITPLLNLVTLFSFGMLCFGLSRTFLNFYLAKRVYAFATMTTVISIAQLIGLLVFHAHLEAVVWVMSLTGIVNCLLYALMHTFIGQVIDIENNVEAGLDLFRQKHFAPRMLPPGKLRILIFNWRDTKHVWAGGAEVYVQELAEELVAQGHSVLTFCGNDGHKKRNDIINGVRIIRRGGFYTVYIWAALYYLLRLRGRYDLVIDCENGVPFFTPLYVRVPKILLIHHIHQQVFREHLPFPLSRIAMLIEAKLMPLAYRHASIVTVSESSRRALLNLGLSRPDEVTVIHPGIKVSVDKKSNKTKHPTMVYVGRLKPYKNIGVAIKAFAKLHAQLPTAQLHIAGDGESRDDLRQLAQNLRVQDSVIFHGHVTQEKKQQLLAQSWVAVQPSKFEGWGITVIEANAAGTPVVASNVDGLRDSVIDGKTGLLVRSGDVDGFANACLKLIKNSKLRSSYGRNALKWSREFDWKHSAEKLMSLVDRLRVATSEHGTSHSSPPYSSALTKSSHHYHT